MSAFWWLASYPKAGNTWLRAVWTAYREPDAPLDINRLHGGPTASSRSVFDEWAGVESSDLTAAEIERLRPAVWRYRAAVVTPRVLVKVHDAWTVTDRGEPIFPPEITRGIIYIVRHPGDVAVSFAAHSGVPVSTALEWLCQDDYVLSPEGHRQRDQVPQRLLSWSGHVASWVDTAAQPLIVVRYEDLLTAPVAEFRRVLAFTDGVVDDVRLERAVEMARFERLRAHEQRHGFRERPAASTSGFFRTGRAGQWRDQFTPQMRSRLLECHGAMMARFGYLEENA